MTGRLMESIGLALALIAAPAASQTSDPGDIESSIWLTTPDDAVISASYPEAASAQFVEGSATLECTVLRDTTARCSVSAESPVGWGFGEAALQIGEGFRVRPATLNGAEVDGRRVRRSVRFVLPDEDEGANGPGIESDALLSALPDLPYWDDAPDFSASLSAYPPEARRARIRGRGVLSCRVRDDRRLTCELVTEIPTGMGFGQAALSLHGRFRVSPRDSGFAAQHRELPFLLPITFSEVREAMPVNRGFFGLGSWNLPRMLAPPSAYPEAARNAGVEGRAVVFCIAGEAPPPVCAIESESPAGWGFGAATLEAFSDIPLAPDEQGWVLKGDQARITAEFRLEN
jgi:TonB family protein